MTKIIAIANQKGGVAKTTTTASMAASLKQRGYKVLAIDLDPQGNLSDSAGAETFNSPTSYELLRRKNSAKEAIQILDVFDIIPSDIMLATAEQELSETGKEHRLKEAIEPIKDRYDFILIDTPPSLGILTINALTAADEVLVPSTAGIYAAKGIHQLYNTILNTRKYCNPNLKINGVLLTRYNPHTIINREVKELTEDIATSIQAPVYETFIRNSVIVEEAQANKKDIFTYKKDATVARDYDAFIDEFLQKGN